MLHLNFDKDKLDKLTATHYAAVEDYVKRKASAEIDSVYDNIRSLFPSLAAKRNVSEFSWLENFILTDVLTLEKWVKHSPDKLKFSFFKNIYNEYFAVKGKYVDEAKKYNAYTLFKLMELSVCPYCDDESIYILNTDKGEKRTNDFDHFYPKGDDFYPGLAMCFFNLIPSCKTCNQPMLTDTIDANPYHPDIELWSKFIPNIPVGANLFALPDSAFTITLQTSHGMTRNNSVLDLLGRYNKHNTEIKQLLIASRVLFSDEAIATHLNMGMDANTLQQLKFAALGNPYPTDKGKKLHQKLKYDLTGY